MLTQSDNQKSRRIQRFVLWTLVAVYTLLLPFAISIYDAIVKHFSATTARQVPFAIILLLGLVYLAAIVKMKKGIKALVLLVPCTIIVYVFMVLEPNPNKHVHIPEYIVMAWLLFEALSLDYKGKGMLVLVFICSSLLGIVDELLQGVHPQRFYGWQDMVMNSAATVIGILTLAGLRTRPTGDWAWVGSLKQQKNSLGVMLLGIVGTILMCVYLLDVKAHQTFWGVYPVWLLGWNGLFMLAGSIVIFYPKLLGELAHSKNDRNPSSPGQAVTARLWTLCPLVILVVIHGFGVLIAATGMPFG